MNPVTELDDSLRALDACLTCGEPYVNIGHPLKLGVIMQRHCRCTEEFPSVLASRDIEDVKAENLAMWAEDACELLSELPIARVRGWIETHGTDETSEQPLRDLLTAFDAIEALLARKP